MLSATPDCSPVSRRFYTLLSSFFLASWQDGKKERKTPGNRRRLGEKWPGNSWLKGALAPQAPKPAPAALSEDDAEALRMMAETNARVHVSPTTIAETWAAFLRIQLIFSLVKLRLFRADRSAITYPLAHLSKTRHRLCLCLCQRDPCGHGGVSGAEQRREPGSVDTNERLVAGYGRGEGPERRTEAGPGTRPHRNHLFTFAKSSNIRLFFTFFFG